MTRLTKNRSYPYPTDPERASGGYDVEQLARAVDRDVKAVDTLWQTDLVRPSFAMTGTDSGIPNGVDWATSLGTTEYSVGNPDTDIEAYWLVSVNVSLTPSGTINTSTQRALKVRVNELKTGGLVTVEEYQCQDFQADAAVWLAVEFVTRLSTSRFVEVNVNHANTGSTVNLTARACYTWLSAA